MNEADIARSALGTVSWTIPSREMHLRRSCKETVLGRITKTRLLSLAAMGRVACAFHLGDYVFQASWNRREN